MTVGCTGHVAPHAAANDKLLISHGNFRPVARVWYSVMGEGFGHALRSDVILSYLVKRHEVVITATDQAYEYLKPRYGNKVHRIGGGRFIYEHNQMKLGKSVLNLARLAPGLARTVPALQRLTAEFRPDLLISDFEASSRTIAKARHIPCISIDNVQSLTQVKVRLPAGQGPRHHLARAFITTFYAPSNYYIIPAFATHRPRNPKRTFIVPPIVQQDVERLHPGAGDFVLVYQTTASNVAMLKVLRKSGQRFIVYGMGKRKNSANITFKGFSRPGFLDDLRTCSFVIVNGGFTVISEAVYLRKPVLAIPIRNQTEQLYNAHCLREMGYGNYPPELSLADLDQFLMELPRYRANLARLKPWSQKPLFILVERLIKRLQQAKKQV